MGAGDAPRSDAERPNGRSAARLGARTDAGRGGSRSPGLCRPEDTLPARPGTQRAPFSAAPSRAPARSWHRPAGSPPDPS